MDEPGKQLERVVREIERHLLPDGFNVSCNEHVFNDAGIQIAEFDIIITGILGSSSINWLIECRDRPSDGPAPGSWIEQLVGRRSRFLFDKVIAVSTTGFAKGAVDYANSEGIVLRTVTNVTDIASDFIVKEFCFITSEVKVTGTMNVKTANPDDERSFTARQPQFKLIEETNYRSLQDFVLDHLPIPTNTQDDSIQQFVFKYEGFVDALINDETVIIRELSVPIQLTTRVLKGKILAVVAYSEDNRMIGHAAEFELCTPEGTFHFPVLLLNKPEGGQDLTVLSLDRLPEGLKIESVALFGLPLTEHKSPAQDSECT